MTLLAMSLSSDGSVSVEDVARELAPLGGRVVGARGVRVSGVRQDSRRIEPGELFCARAGKAARGADFVAEALARGARALLVEAGTALAAPGVPVIEVNDVRRAIGLAAELVYGRPSRALALVGITGTNGKTTTSVLVEHALAALGQKPARLGTLGFAFGSEADEGALTTPEADDVSRYLRDVVRRSGTHFVMEVSSHALSLARVDALGFRVAAFSNLSQDHLDFYASMVEYGAAKARLFEALSPEVSVLNSDDPFGLALAERAKGRVLTTGRRPDAGVRALEAELDARGVTARVATPGGEVRLTSRLLGAHNLENLLLALGILCALGFESEAAARALASAPAVPGRLERCDEDQDDIRVLVDYAHTPDALERVLAALARVTPGELVCVFGCGGDRDPGKRPKMGAAVARGAARAVLTSDNPRSEDPAKIAAEVERGLAAGPARYSVELDRARAIELAVLGARPGDSVLVAGKGHETYQLVGSERRAFDDRVEARRALALRRRGRPA
jgi:UDP-N-acetylmuramoyl-L-alanyl-D-glutamate--2,6-diaminopimelate ligase